MEQINYQFKSFFGEAPICAWSSKTYLAAAFDEGDAVRLDVCRHDLRDGITWDDLREIKKSCGFSNNDAVEFFPAEKDVINTGNIRHLYIFKHPLPHVRRL